MKKLIEQLRSLTMKEKVEYLIEYYSFHIIGIIVVLSVLVMGFNNFTNQPNELLSIRIVKNDISDKQAKELHRSLEKVFIDNKKETLSVQTINMKDIRENSEALIKLQKLGAEITAKEVDVLLVDKDVFHQFNKEGNLYNLNNFHAFDNWETIKYATDNDSTTITGIDVSEVPILSSIVTKGEPLIFVVMANTERMDGVENFVHLLTE
ncbi:hypothetical protein [Peribacillus huizhouensis]|uniref:ABC transporter permease n=1 Tax=Peribacillus huizhouensis TaxID=1501239 RepID=A0ABR6CNQ4_9BACI|nr:hypothetical protein [Peribacillus huizhouensis]MBA9026672.1 hypothetical protein [Peribacillus huizhouensis]